MSISSLSEKFSNNTVILRRLRWIKNNLMWKRLRKDCVSAGPLTFKTNGGKETKVYILLFTCSLTRAMNLKVLPNHSTQEFIIALIRLITRRGSTSVIYSDHANTFVVPSKWIDKINNDETRQEYLIKD